MFDISEIPDLGSCTESFAPSSVSDFHHSKVPEGMHDAEFL